MQQIDPELQAAIDAIESETKPFKESPSRDEGEDRLESDKPTDEVTQGKYIAIEGPDGSGKTLVCEYIKELLGEAGRDIQQVNILSTHKNSLALRQIVTDPATEMHPRTELSFYIAAVMNSLTQLVGPMTRSGQNVITDRGPDSSLVYQCLSLCKNDPVMLEMHNAAFKGLHPDITIYLEPASVEEGLDRCVARDGSLDRLEQRGPEYQKTVLDNYKLVYSAKLFRNESVYWIENNSSKESLKEKIKEVLLRAGLLEEASC